MQGRRRAWVTRHQPWLVESVDATIGGNLVPGGLDGLIETWAHTLTKPETRRAYLRDVEGFLGHVAVRTDRELMNVREGQVAAWRDFLARELDAGRLSYQSCKRRMAAATSLFDYLNGEGHVTKNPVRPVKRPPRPAADRQRERRRQACPLSHCPAAGVPAEIGNSVPGHTVSNHSVPDLLLRLVPGRQLTFW